MRLAGALLVLAVVAVVVTLAVVIRGSRDTIPGEIADCVRDRGGRTTKGSEGLALARPDVQAGHLRRAARYDLGRDEGVLLRGSGGYAVLVVRAPGNPPLAGDLARRVFQDPSAFALVAAEADPVRGVLDACARRAGR